MISIFHFFKDIVDRTDIELLNHDAIIKMIELKRNKFGMFWLGIESLFYIALTLICTGASFLGNEIHNEMEFTNPIFVSWVIVMFTGQVMIIMRAANVSKIHLTTIKFI